jgi:hypothetical protein
MNITYKDTVSGKLEGRNLMDFGVSPETWEALKNAQVGDHFTVEREKDKAGKYWNWVAVYRQDGAAAAASPRPAAVFEDKRQRYIIRQSSLGHAVELGIFHKMGSDAVMELAGQFEQWVLRETE